LIEHLLIKYCKQVAFINSVHQLDGITYVFDI